MGTYVLVQGAWHTGRELAPVAALIEAAGHKVFTPTARKGLDTPFSTSEMEIKVESGKCRSG